MLKLNQNGNLLIWIAVLVVLTIILAGGGYYYVRSSKPAVQSNFPVVYASPSSSAKPSLPPKSYPSASITTVESATPSASPNGSPSLPPSVKTDTFSCEDISKLPENPNAGLSFANYYCGGGVCGEIKTKAGCQTADVVKIEEGNLVSGTDGAIDCKWVDGPQSGCSPNK